MAVSFDINGNLKLKGPTNLKSTVAKVQSAFSSIKTNININSGGASSNLHRLSQTVQSLNKKLLDTAPAASSASAALKSLSTIGQVKIQINTARSASSLTTLTRAVNAFNSSLATTTPNIDAFNAALARMSSTAAGTRGNFRSISVSAKSFAKSINNITTSTNAARKSTHTWGELLGETTRRFGAFAVVAATVSTLVVLMKKSAVEALNFDREMIRVKQVTGEANVSLSSLRDTITKLSTDLGVSSLGLLKAATTLRQAGMSATETKDALEVLAQTQLTPNFDDIDKTTEGLIAIKSQFKETIRTSKDLSAAFDAINTSAAAFAFESSDVIDAVIKSGGAFASAGGNIQQFISLFGAVRSTTRETADTIATGLRTISARIQRPKTQDKLRLDFGIDLRTKEGQFIGIYKAIEKIDQATRKLKGTDPKFAELLQEIGGIRQISKTLPLIRQIGLAQEIYNSQLNSSGSIARDATTAQQALLVQLTKLQEKFHELFRTILESTGFRSLIGLMITLTDKVLALHKSLGSLASVLSVIGSIKLGGALGSIGVHLAGKVIGGGSTAPSGSGGKLFEFIKNFAKPFRKAKGGIVPGVGDTDSVHAYLPPGAFVINKKSTKALGMANALLTPGEAVFTPEEAKKIGYGKLEHLNRFATGGKKKDEDETKIHVAGSNSETVFNPHRIPDVVEPTPPPRQVTPRGPITPEMQRIRDYQAKVLRERRRRSSEGDFVSMYDVVGQLSHQAGLGREGFDERYATAQEAVRNVNRKINNNKKTRPLEGVTPSYKPEKVDPYFREGMKDMGPREAAQEMQYAKVGIGQEADLIKGKYKNSFGPDRKIQATIRLQKEQATALLNKYQGSNQTQIGANDAPLALPSPSPFEVSRSNGAIPLGNNPTKKNNELVKRANEARQRLTSRAANAGYPIDHNYSLPREPDKFTPPSVTEQTNPERNLGIRSRRIRETKEYRGVMVDPTHFDESKRIAEHRAQGKFRDRLRDQRANPGNVDFGHADVSDATRNYINSDPNGSNDPPNKPPKGPGFFSRFMGGSGGLGGDPPNGPNNPSRFSRLKSIGGKLGKFRGLGTAAAIAAPLIADYAFGNAENTKEGTAGGYLAHAGSTIGGAVSGAATGFATTGNPFVAIAGAVAGATQGFESFSKQLENVKIKKFGEDIDSILTDFESNKGSFSSPKDAEDFRKNIIGLSEGAQKSTTNGVTGRSLSDFISPTAITSAILPTLGAAFNQVKHTATFGYAGKGFNESLNESANAQEEQNQAARRELVAPNFEKLTDVLTKRITESHKTSSELRKDANFKPLFEALDRLKINVNQQDIEKSDSKFLVANRGATQAAQDLADAKKLADAEKLLAEKTNALIGGFDRFSDALDGAVEKAGRSFATHSTPHDAFAGKIGFGSDLADVGSLGPAGAELKNFSERGGGFDRMKELLRKSLGNAGGGTNENISDNIIGEIEKGGGFGGSIGGKIKEIAQENLRANGSEVLNKFKNGDQEGAIGDVLDKVAKNLDSQGKKATAQIAKAMQMFGQAMVGIAEKTNNINDTLVESHNIASERHTNFMETGIRLKDRNTDPSGRNMLSDEESLAAVRDQANNNRFNFRQSQRFGVTAGNEQNAAAIGEQLNTSQYKLKSAVLNQRDLQQKNDPIETQQKAMEDVVNASSEVSNLTQALKNLANSTELVSSAQEKLNAAIDAELSDKAARRNDAETLTFGSAKDRQQVFRAQRLQDIAAQQGNLNGFGDKEKQMVLERLKSNGGQVNTQQVFDRFGRQRGVRQYRNSDLYEQLIAGNTRPSELQQETISNGRNRFRVSSRVANAQREVDAASQRQQAGNDELAKFQQRDRKDAQRELAANQFNFNKEARAELPDFAPFQKAVNNLAGISNSSPLIDAMNSFPETLKVEQNGTIQVIINGAEVLTRIKGEMGAEITQQVLAQVQAQLPQMLKNVPA